MKINVTIWEKIIYNIKKSKLGVRAAQNNGNYVILAIITILALIFVINGRFIIGWDFRNNLWGPAYLLTQHKSPYQINELFEIANAVWMPMIIGLFFPLGWLPLQQASNLWFLGNFLCLPLITWISFDLRKPSVSFLAGSTILYTIFPPLITHFMLGQVSLLITCIFLLVVLMDKSIRHRTNSVVAIALQKSIFENA
jgi:hypothetical protein